MKRNPWEAARRVHLTTYPECRVCGTFRTLVVHHVRYRGPRGKSERPGDLVTLCEHHHNELHRVLGRTPPVAEQLALIQAWRARVAVL